MMLWDGSMLINLFPKSALHGATSKELAHAQAITSHFLESATGTLTIPVDGTELIVFGTAYYRE
jgi:hypothetical protein